MLRVAAILLAASALLCVPAGAGGDTPAPDGSITIDLARPVNKFTGNRPLGATLDGHGRGETAQIYTPANVAAMRSSGYAQLTYRLRTELGAEAWHWNPRGHWSDPRHQRGYWVSDPRGPRYAVSFGYRLPRRGNTIDQANDEGYSRLDDGNARTFWKSDPYLDPHYTREPDALHAQWLQVDLGSARPVDAAQLDWAAPYARRVRVQYWSGTLPPWRNGAELENEVFAAGGTGAWRDFPRQPRHSHGGVQRLRLATPPIVTRYVRVLMNDSSHTHPRGANDIRDRLGFALYEIHVGALDARGRLHDWVRHAPGSRRQSVVWVSSTDPWHRASDLDPGYEQPSFDTVFSSGLRKGQPVLVPVAMLYGNPADAANELRFLRARGYPLRGVELGQEPDGQLIDPEDDGSLYAQFARALRRADPRVPLGGPSLSTAIPDWTVPPDAHGNTSWTGRFVTELRRRHALGQLGFFSFEWYPVDDLCSDPSEQLLSAAAQLPQLIARQRRAGLPTTIPLVISEYGWSPFAAQAEVSMTGALLDADAAARFLSLGGRTAYLYGTEPDALMNESVHCRTFGNLILWQADDRHRILHPVAALYAARLLGRDWLAPGAGVERMYATSSDVRDSAGRELVSGYAVRRADGTVSLLLVNLDPARSHAVRVTVRSGTGLRELAGPAHLFQYSPAQYQWHAEGPRGRPARDRPPAQASAGAGPLRLDLPPSSLTVAVAPLFVSTNR